MTFPTKADIEFFKEAKRIQELCQDPHPQVGDWFAHWAGDKWIALCWTGELALCLDDVIWLPRQGQLQEMLEERGCFWDMCGPFPDTAWIDDCEEYLVEIEYKDAVGLLQDGAAYGSTPSIALGKCLLEVLGD